MWRRFRLHNEAACRVQLFELYAPLARKIARYEVRRRPSYGLNGQDLEQYAYAGLLESIDRYDPMHGAPFASFAKVRMRGAISNGLAQSSEAGAQYTFRRRIERERIQSLRDEKGAQPASALEELACLAGNLALGIIAEGLATLIEQPEMNAYESLEWRSLQLHVLSELEQLPETEHLVMRKHYLEGLQFSHIAELLGLTKGRVSQIHRAAVERLRTRILHSTQGAQS